MNTFPIILGLAAVLLAPLARAHDDDEESVIVVGRNSAGLLKVELGFTPPLELDPSVFPGISGYATGLLGMHSVAFDDPAGDFFLLSTAADFRFILVAKDPGMEIWLPAGYMQIGDSFYIGPSPFDTHPIWNLVAGTEGTDYSLTLKLHDVNGIYPDSAPFSLSFTPEPVPRYLSLSQTDPTHAILTWPTNATAWTLETASALTETDWTTVTNLPGVTGTNFSLTLTNAASPQFFRLHLP